jgi:FKBP-type peptidyl-prolyl cis-trans isomerase FkpA
MRKQATLVAFAITLAFVNVAVAHETKVPQTDDQKVLYAAGAVLAQNIATWNLKPDEIAFVLQGLEDAATGKKSAVSLDEVRPKIQAFAQSRASAAAVAEKKAAEPFLAKAAAEKGAKKTDSGLIVTEITAGSGATPKSEDKVKANYRGTLIDGTEFDSSESHGGPVSFPVTGVIPCWTEALQTMKVGGKVKLVCPPEIAYGERGFPPKIKPGATLVFEVELLGIEPPADASAAPAPAPPKK